jgi:Ni/Fe-hydrogenase subunit HybB-like protein
MQTHSEPVSGPLQTRTFRVLLAFVGIAAAILAWRFLRGLGATTALNDGYPWGLWIAMDVVVGTALATGGYMMALVVYVLNRGRYHPLVRSALVTSALGYTLAGFGVIIDLGRWWNVYKVPISERLWNFESVLLEVALCIMLYTAVLWIELAPAFFEKWKKSSSGFAREFAQFFTPKLERVLPFIIALGILLPTMHQSSLGSLMLLAGEKLHPLWQTPLLPLLFLVSCMAMGYAAVTMESQLSSHIFRRPSEQPLLEGLARPVAFVLLGFLVIRVVDLLARGKAEHVLAFDTFSTIFALEVALFAVPAALLLRGRKSERLLFQSALLIVLGGALYRFSTFLIAYNPAPGWSYFPAVPELFVTLGIISGEVILYLLLIKRLPILAAVPPRRMVHLGTELSVVGPATLPLSNATERIATPADRREEN